MYPFSLVSSLSIIFLLLANVGVLGCQIGPNYVYVSYTNSTGQPFILRESQPYVSPSQCTVPIDVHTAGCCKCNGGDTYVCPSLDSALLLATTHLNTTNGHFYISLGRRNWELNHSYQFNLTHSVILQGFDNAMITCTNYNSIIVNASCSTLIHNVLITNCSGESESSQRGAITIINGVHLNVNYAVFFENKGTGLMIAQENSLLYQIIECITEEFHQTINNSYFKGNGDGSKFGGGVYITIQTSNAPGITIANSRFISNIAGTGGGIYYQTQSSSSYLANSNIFNLIECIFYNNSAANHGGGAYLYYSNVRSTFQGVQFINNSALYTAGGVYQYTEDIPSSLHTSSSGFIELDNKHDIIYKNCTWSGNVSPGSGAFLLFSPSNITSSPTYFENCTFNSNYVTQSFFSGQAACIIHSQNVPLYYTDVIMSNSNGTALCIQSCVAYFIGSNNFTSNNGFLGGAAFIDHANFYFQIGSRTQFISNNAIYGGGIYQNSLTQINCIFQFNQTSHQSSDISVHFYDNQAISNGKSIFFQNPTGNCRTEINNSYVTFEPKTEKNQYSSGAFHLDFHHPVTSNQTMELILGQQIIFNTTIKNFFNQSAFAQINLFLRSSDNINAASSLFRADIPYELQGFHEFTIANGLNFPNIYIQGPQVNQTTLDYYLTIEGLHVSKTINIILKECPLGYRYNLSTGTCECFEAPHGLVKCNPYSGTACIAVGYWIGEVDGQDTISACSSGYCQSSNNECPQCSLLDSDDDYCLLPSTMNEQCLDNRDGRLCAYCKDGYAFTFGSTKCVKDSTCSKGQGIIPPLLNIFFLIITFIVLILALKFNYRLSSGYIFGFVYYFSIVGHLLPQSIVGDTLLEIVSIFESITQLNPRFLGHIPICFSTILTALEQKVFLYINPFIITVFVLATIWLSKCCPNRLSFKDNTLIKAICLLLLLSFTALSETSFNIFNGISFEGTHTLYVTIQPETKYHDLVNHLIWLFISTLVMIILVIPFTFLLLFAPLLSRCINLNKIKPFLDEFQGCYKDNFRWMAGYYFLCRFLYFLVLAFPVGLHYSILQYVIQLLSFAILVIHMLIQPYEDKWLNFSDSLLLADLTLLSLIFGETGDTAFGRDSPVRQIIVYVLVFIPVLYLIVLIGVTAGKRFNAKDRLEYRSQISLRRRRRDELNKPLIPTTVVNRHEWSDSLSVEYRDPVLGLLERSEDMTSSRSSPSSTDLEDCRERRGWTTASIPSPISYSIIESPREYRSSSGLNQRTSSQNWQNEERVEEGDDL